MFRCAQKHPEKAPAEFKQLVLDDIARFTGDAEQYDDMTLVICKFI